MEKICKNCHWYKSDKEYSQSINCLEHVIKVKENDTCESFCKDGEYVPTGIWADISSVVKSVAEKIESEGE